MTNIWMMTVRQPMVHMRYETMQVELRKKG